ncbi:MAG: hypothetical protein FWF54_05995 [Candidatus Azobacteroides sp.]|nr:hypothetical protein [Candidatus Azobacteroides sp.]
MDLVKIKLKDLKAYTESEQFKKFAVKPISPLRAESYIANPRADSEDIVLYMLIEGEVLVAFRTILTDYLYTKNDEIIKFGWYSGNWVSLKHRRKGYSKFLMKESFKDWNGKMMALNMAENSKLMFLKSRKMFLFKQRLGIRFYLYPDLMSILKDKVIFSKVKWCLPMLSKLIGFYTKLKLSIFYKKNNLFYCELNNLDDECNKYIENNHIKSNELFQRSKTELAWIFQYPWITNKQTNKFNYPFSYLVSDFKFRVIKILKDGETTGFFIYSLINRKMKILYYFINCCDIYDMCNIILYIAICNKINYLTILDEKLTSQMKNQSFYFAFHKTIESNIFSSFIIEDYKEKIIYDGDGDNCFT